MVVQELEFAINLALYGLLYGLAFLALYGLSSHVCITFHEQLKEIYFEQAWKEKQSSLYLLVYRPANEL